LGSNEEARTVAKQQPTAPTDRPTIGAAETVRAEKLLLGLLPTTRPADSILNPRPCADRQKEACCSGSGSKQRLEPCGASLHLPSYHFLLTWEQRLERVVISGRETQSHFSRTKREWAKEVPRGRQRNAIFF